MIKAKHPSDKPFAVPLGQQPPMTADELRVASDALSRDIDVTLADCIQKIDRLQAERADLLAACRLFAKAAHDVRFQPYAVEKARAAIKKAEGRT